MEIISSKNHKKFQFVQNGEIGPMRERALIEITKKFQKNPKKFQFVQNGEIGPMRERALIEITKKVKKKITKNSNLSKMAKIVR